MKKLALRPSHAPYSHWVDMTDSARMTKGYIALTPTVDGTSGTTTLTASGDLSNDIYGGFGQTIQVNSSEVYTVSSISTSVGISTITTVETLTASYSAKAIATDAVSSMRLVSGSITGQATSNSTTARRPIYIPSGMNSLPCLLFKGIPGGTTGSTMSIGLVAGVSDTPNWPWSNNRRNGGLTVISICQPFATTANQCVISKQNQFSTEPNRAFALRNNRFVTSDYALNNSFRTNQAADFSATAAKQILAGRWKPGGFSRAYRNGALVATGTEKVERIDAHNSFFERFIFGGTIDDTGLEGFGGLIGEIKLWPRDLSDAEFSIEHQRLANRWGVTLA